MIAGEKQYKFEEILPIYKAVSGETDVGTFADFMEAFKTFDREGQGYIAMAELRHVLCSLGKHIRVPSKSNFFIGFKNILGGNLKFKARGLTKVVENKNRTAI